VYHYAMHVPLCMCPHVTCQLFYQTLAHFGLGLIKTVLLMLDPDVLSASWVQTRGPFAWPNVQVELPYAGANVQPLRSSLRVLVHYSSPAVWSWTCFSEETMLLSHGDPHVLWITCSALSWLHYECTSAVRKLTQLLLMLPSVSVHNHP